MNGLSVFTGTNTVLVVNDKPLGFVQSVDVEDVNNGLERYTAITLRRFPDGHENEVNEMRSGLFSFKICNDWNPEHVGKIYGGYVAIDAELLSFKMHLSAKNDGAIENLLEQTIVIKAKSFMYTKDARSNIFATPEEKDEFDKLVAILKQNQDKDKQNVVVLPATVKIQDKKAKKNKKK